MQPAPTRQRQRARLDIDRAIRRHAPKNNQKARQAYFRLTTVVQQKSTLLRAQTARRYGPASIAEQVTIGLVNLSAFHNAWRRPSENWRPTGDTPRAVFNSLVRYLLDDYPVPAFMTACWLMSPDDHRDHQTWYTHFGRSGTIRGTSTDRVFTRHQAGCFAQAPGHASIEEALNRGQRGIGKDQRVPRPRLVTRRHWKRQHASRQQWHRGDWPGISIPDFTTPDDSKSPYGYRSWSIRQIIRKTDLIREGVELRHCVGSYFEDCRRGQTTIWSLRSHGLTSDRRVLTIELNPKQRRVVTALGYRNRRPSADARRVMERWARLNHLSVASWV